MVYMPKLLSKNFLKEILLIRFWSRDDTTQCVRIKLINEVNLIRILILLKREDLVSFRLLTTHVLDSDKQ